MKRNVLVVLALAALVSAWIAVNAVAASRGTMIKLSKTSSGKILTTSRGFTLYMFSKDKRNRTCA